MKIDITVCHSNKLTLLIGLELEANHQNVCVRDLIEYFFLLRRAGVPVGI